MATTTFPRKDPEIKYLMFVVYILLGIGIISSMILIRDAQLKEQSKAVFKCVDGIKYEVKNGKELHILLTNQGHTFGC